MNSYFRKFVIAVAVCAAPLAGCARFTDTPSADTAARPSPNTRNVAGDRQDGIGSAGERTGNYGAGSPSSTGR